MTVWIAMAGDGYEADWILAVFDTKAKADAACSDEKERMSCVDPENENIYFVRECKVN